MSNKNMVPNVILVYAFRYALPRESGAVSDAIEAIKDNVSNFRHWELNNLLGDIAWENNLRRTQEGRHPNQLDIDEFSWWLKEVIAMKEEIGND